MVRRDGRERGVTVTRRCAGGYPPSDAGRAGCRRGGRRNGLALGAVAADAHRAPLARAVARARRRRPSRSARAGTPSAAPRCRRRARRRRSPGRARTPRRGRRPRARAAPRAQARRQRGRRRDRRAAMPVEDGRAPPARRRVVVGQAQRRSASRSAMRAVEVAPRDGAASKPRAREPARRRRRGEDQRLRRRRASRSQNVFRNACTRPGARARAGGPRAGGRRRSGPRAAD